ncbi:MAG: hypothetical protein JXR25_14920 [Pontiellaceae bacterium]|nr:hypothetical protein [Pontiellaceae bacterium]MBN2786111.1 hypothetical protein [Pontiellaceae bacterium]
MQGLPTVGQLTDPEGKRSGWNADPADADNRDLKFFDAVYDALKEEIDADRIYCTGHSNGGSFTYCLWAARSALFAAVAPSSAAVGRSRMQITTPLPALHLAGRTDPLVKYAWQEQTMQFIRKLNRCADAGTPWATSGDLAATCYPSEGGTPFISLIHPGGHRFPEEAPPLMVRFFKEHARSPAPQE